MARASLVVCLCLALCAFATARTRWHELEAKGYDFQQYMAEFGKRYSLEEQAVRKPVFDRNLAGIMQHNARTDVSWKQGVNQFTDWTESEFRQLRGYDKMAARRAHQQQQPQALSSVSLSAVSSLPTTVDWRLKGAVTPIKDQGGCGSCWAFASTETMESAWFLATGTLGDLSPQQVASCTLNPNDCGGTGGCGGGIAELAYQQAIDNGGMSSEFSYPYVSYGGQNYGCRLNDTYFSFSPWAKFSSWVKLPVNDQNALLQAVATVGPIAISVDASSWSGYEEGVFAGCNMASPDVDHVVQLVGYGTSSDGQDYWLVRNSWATTWGEDGYIRIQRPSTAPCGVDPTPGDGSACKPYPANVTVCGMCGLLSDSSYPVASPSRH